MEITLSTVESNFYMIV